MKYDVFISHASENKDDVARPLALMLQQIGFSVWFDEFELTLGDSLRRSIDRGLSESEFGVVILSPEFFRKEWPQKELDGLVAREDQGNKVVLPVWHNVDSSSVSQYSPILASKLAVSTSKGIDGVAEAIAKAISRGRASDENDGALTWAHIDEALRTGLVDGVPAGTDLEEFIWQNMPESRPEIEARNPGRKFVQR